MISEVVMPQMGADMEEGTIVRWLKKEGDAVERGEIIAEIETDKANVEIEAFESGSFGRVLVPEGETVDVGTVIAVIASPGEDLSKYAATQAKPAEQPSVETKAPVQHSSAESAAAAPSQPASGKPRPAPGASKVALATEGTDGRVRASPVARKIAQDRGIDLQSIRGTGPDGRIVKRDVESAATTQPSTATGPAGQATPVQMSKMRQTIARRMSQSKREAPHYYITVDIDMSAAEQLRAQLNSGAVGDVHVSVNDLIVKACAEALERHPEFNATYENDQVQQHETVNVSIGIALDEGLIAPAVIDCGNKTVVEISEASKSLAERAKTGALKPDEYTGGTFTVSNLGMFGVETLIAIIQPPQTAILGAGTVREEPVARNGQVSITKLMKVALSADHRVTDGAQGAQFMSEIKRLLENPAALLVEAS
jgi:pyruvate dehydrogenase E2 component (dihydrolipoamide acetyltransferase)